MMFDSSDIDRLVVMFNSDELGHTGRWAWLCRMGLWETSNMSWAIGHYMLNSEENMEEVDDS